MNRLLLSVSFIFLFHLCFSQIEQKKLDSLQQSIKASADTYKQWQDSFNQAQMQKGIESSEVDTTEFAKQYREHEKKRGQLKAVRYIILGAALLVLLIIGLLRKRKMTSNIKSLLVAFALLAIIPGVNAQQFDSIKIQTVPVQQANRQKINDPHPYKEYKEPQNQWERRKQTRRERYAWGFIALIVVLTGSVVYEIYRIVKTETQA